MNNKRKLNSSGFFLVNKPEDITSSDLVQYVKRITKVKKIGHTGTLDKFASGLLILPYGRYTSFASHFLNANKTYIAKAVVGKFTDSGDRDGKVLYEISVSEAEHWLIHNKEKLIQELKNLIYLTEQIPPKISALKIQGKRQSDLFRQNIEFESRPRPIKIYYLNILEISNISFTFEVEVSSGTYIRKLIIDISRTLNIPIYLENLVRIQIGKVNRKYANSLTDFELGQAKSFSPLEILDIPYLIVNEKEELQILRGKKIFIPNVPEEFLFINSKQEVLAWCKREKESYEFCKVFS